jgi:hypothetical protein
MSLKEMNDLMDRMKPESLVKEIEGVTESMPSILPIITEGCPFCESKWKGGCERPGNRFTGVGRRVFYECGCSVSIWCDLGNGSVHILAKNCLKLNDKTFESFMEETQLKTIAS